MRQWFGVLANAVQNTGWTHIINNENYKIIYWNAMDCHWANVAKEYTLPHLPILFLPWRAYAVQRQFGDPEWPAMESYCWHQYHCSNVARWQKHGQAMRLEAIAVVSDTLFSERYVMGVFYFSQLIAEISLMPEYSTEVSTLYSGISLASPSSNLPRIDNLWNTINTGSTFVTTVLPHWN